MCECVQLFRTLLSLPADDNNFIKSLKETAGKIEQMRHMLFVGFFNLNVEDNLILES